jgi:plasmid stabilization system protein ParE
LRVDVFALRINRLGLVVLQTIARADRRDRTGVIALENAAARQRCVETLQHSFHADMAHE